MRRTKVKKQKLDKKGCPRVPRVFKKKASLEKVRVENEREKDREREEGEETLGAAQSS